MPNHAPKFYVPPHLEDMWQAGKEMMLGSLFVGMLLLAFMSSPLR